MYLVLYGLLMCSVLCGFMISLICFCGVSRLLIVF